MFVFFFFVYISACRMARGQEETSISQAGCRQGPTQETPSTSSVISSLSMEELRSYYQIPDNIDFELLDGLAESTLDEEDNAMFFTREKLATGPRFPVSSLVKQFFHFTRAPPVWMLRFKPSLPFRLFIGGSLFCLHLKLGAWRPAVHVSPESPIAICYRTPRLS